MAHGTFNRPLSPLTYAQISQWIDAIAPELKAQDFVAIVAVLRGGIFPAQCAAFATARPLHFMTYDRGTQTANWFGPLPPEGRILVCDDIAGYGMTLANCVDLAQKSHPELKVLTVVADELSRRKPDWSMDRPGVQSVLPWEREIRSLQYQEDWLAGGGEGRIPMKSDIEYQNWGIDLDGVLCVDISPAEYEKNLEQALSMRDLLPRAPNSPPLKSPRHVIVTGRPTIDTERTRRWLDAQGYQDIAVYHRDLEKFDHSIERVAKYKAETASSLGLTHYLESCPQQAILIAHFAPYLQVFWWRDGKPMLVTAFESAAF